MSSTFHIVEPRLPGPWGILRQVECRLETAIASNRGLPDGLKTRTRVRPESNPANNSSSDDDE
jgi:hypothetical protein